MLENEEKKMFKKIEDTRKRADAIMRVKQKNEEELINKIRHQRELDDQLESFRNHNYDTKRKAREMFQNDYLNTI